MTILACLAAVVLVALVVCAEAVNAEQAPRPNIVLILADDLGYGDVRALNPDRGKIATPNLDRLAAQGMTFTDAHSGSSVCTPTRYGILTGRYAWRTRLQRGVFSGYVEPLVAEERLTVPGMLKQRGYHSACIGKWHLGFTIAGERANDAERRLGRLGGAPLGAVTHDGPTTRGFDEFFGFHHARMMKSVFEQDRVSRIVEPVDMLPLLANRATTYIRSRAAADEPFFLYLPLSSPHTPIVPSEAWRGKSGLGDYADFVMQTDGVVGEVLAAIDAAGIADNTLVIFTSDNGCSPAAGTNELEKQGHFASERSRGYKSDIWDGGHRVPFLVRWSGRVAAGSRSDRLVCLTDLMATCASIVEFELPDNAGEDSVSFLDEMLRPIGDANAGSSRDEAPSPSSTASPRAIVHHSIEGRFAIRQAKWKLCLCAGSGGWSKGGSASSPQLYDMTADPGERKNVAAQHGDVVAALTRRLERIVADGRSTPGPNQTNDVAVRLRSE